MHQVLLLSILKFALMFAIVSAAIYGLSMMGPKTGDGEEEGGSAEDRERLNRRRGYGLVAVVTLAAAAMAWWM